MLTGEATHEEFDRGSPVQKFALRYAQMPLVLFVSTRSTVSIAAAALKAKGLIAYHRGVIQLLDMNNLELKQYECDRVVRTRQEHPFQNHEFRIVYSRSTCPCDSMHWRCRLGLISQTLPKKREHRTLLRCPEHPARKAPVCHENGITVTGETAKG